MKELDAVQGEVLEADIMEGKRLAARGLVIATALTTGSFSAMIFGVRQRYLRAISSHRNKRCDRGVGIFLIHILRREWHIESPSTKCDHNPTILPTRFQNQSALCLYW